MLSYTVRSINHHRITPTTYMSVQENEAKHRAEEEEKNKAEQRFLELQQKAKALQEK